MPRSLPAQQAGKLAVASLLGGLEERIQRRPRPGATLAPGLPASLQRRPRAMPALAWDVIFPAPEARPMGRELWLGVSVQVPGERNPLTSTMQPETGF